MNARDDDERRRDDVSRYVESELGARALGGHLGRLVYLTCLAWALFQIYVASPLPFLLGGLLDRAFVLNDVQTRVIHYTFAVFLTFCLFPATSRSPRGHIPWLDWAWAAAATGSAFYLFVLHEALSARGGLPTTTDIVVSAIGILTLLEASRRAVGLALTLVAAVFIAFAFAGPYMPDLLLHKGVSFGRMADQMWLATEGVFGIALGVSASFIFLFVMFGSMLERAGAGNYFIKLSFSLLGHLRGGPAKAAVVSSGMTGLISGSAIANIVTTGTFTIPLMKRVGLSAEKAAAVEISASINGQLMPPVMGAAAFLMTEFIGISYVDVIRHAFLPATMSYIGLVYIVHLEAVKLGLPVLTRAVTRGAAERALRACLTAVAVFLALGLGYGLIGWATASGNPFAFTMLLFVAGYLLLLRVSSRLPELEVDDASAPMQKLPDAVPILLTGLYFLLPVVVLIWCLMMERFSPSLSIYWAIIALAVIMVTHRPILAWLRGEDVAAAFRRGCRDLVDGMAAGAHNMVAIAIALAAAGIIVGVVAMTGLGLAMTSIVETISGGNLLAMLFFTALLSVVLGMGLPTTANYIVVSAIMAPVIVDLAAQGGLIVPLIAVHLFVFYFGLISGTTPPVAVDAFAGAALARSEPLKTSMQSFYYSIRTAILPFIFVFNTELLLIGVDSVGHFVMTVTMSIASMLVFVAATQGWFLTRNRLWETAALLLVAFTLARPGFWIDQLYPAFQRVDPLRFENYVEREPDDSLVRLWAEGENFSGRAERRLVVLPLGPRGAAGRERLESEAGLGVQVRDGRLLVDHVAFNGPAQQRGLDFDWEITSLEIPAQRPAKHWAYIPGLLLLGVVIAIQRRRRTAAVPARAAA